jgi:hypothetical protein
VQAKPARRRWSGQRDPAAEGGGGTPKKRYKILKIIF